MGSDFLNIKIGNERYIQRHEFSKLLIFNDDNTKRTLNSIYDLSEEKQQIIKDALTIQENPEDYFEYSIIKPNYIIINKYIGSGLKNVVIPEEIENKKVKTLGQVFFNIIDVERIFMPDTVNKITSTMCSNMLNLKSIHLSPNIKTIPGQTFTSCEKLEKINLENIEIIFNQAFINCKSLKNINLKNVKEIRESAFKNCCELTNLDISNVIKLEADAFANCDNLKHIKFNNNLKEIEDNVFLKCFSLTDIKLPDNLSIIGDGAFYKCTELKTITFPDSIERIGYGAFQLSGLEGEITFPKELKHISSLAFNSTKITKVNMSKNTFCNYAQFPLDAVTNLNLYDSVIRKIKNFFKEKDR